MNTFLEKGYYINLDKRIDRREFMEQQLKTLNLDSIVERFSAYEVDYKERGILEASIATAKGHKEIIQIAKNRGYEKILILEDDALFVENGIENVTKALTQLQLIPNWEIYYLGAHVYDKVIHKASENLIRGEEVISSHAYIVHSRAYDRILSLDNITHFDVMLSRTFTEKYITYPLSVTQRPGDVSDLGGHPTMDFQFWNNQYSRVK